MGIGETHAKTNDQGPFVVQANFSYLNEMVHKQKFFVQCSLINFDKKKMHLFLEIGIILDMKVSFFIFENGLLNDEFPIQ